MLVVTKQAPGATSWATCRLGTLRAIVEFSYILPTMRLFPGGVRVCGACKEMAEERY